MTKIEVLPDEQISTAVHESYELLKKRIGRIPNIYKVYAHSPATLKANLILEESLSYGELSDIEAEIIALVVSEINGCAYCLAAHTAISKLQGMTAEQIMNIRIAKNIFNNYMNLIAGTEIDFQEVTPI